MAAAPASTCAGGVPATATAYGYDGVGNRTTRAPAAGPVSSFGYDQANRLVKADRAPGEAGVAAGWYHSVAADTNGAVWAWGANADGQLGNDTVVDAAVPVRVSGLTGAVAVAAGAWHSAAVKADGTVWAWGDNGSGQLGIGTTTDSSVPVRVPGLSGVVAVAAGMSDNRWL